MRVVAAVETHPLIVALSGALHGIDLVTVRDSAEAVELLDGSSVLLCERRSSDACLSFLAALRHRGVEAPAVLIGDQARQLGDQAVQMLGRPLSIDGIVQALMDSYRDHYHADPQVAVDAEGYSDEEERDDDPRDDLIAAVAAEALDEATELADDDTTVAFGPATQAPPGLASDASPPTDAPVLTLSDAGASALEADTPSGEIDLTGSEPAVRVAPQAPDTPQEGLFRRLMHLWRGNARDSVDRTPLRDSPEQAARLRRAISHTEALREILEEYPLLADVHMTAGIVADEIVETTGLEVVGVLLRDATGEYPVVGHRGLHPGEAELHLPADHPLLRQARDQGGTLTVHPTEPLRGILAGVPGASHEGLVLVLLHLDGVEHGCVVLAYDGPERVGPVRTARTLLDEAAPALALAGAVWRLPGRRKPARDYLRSWER